MIKRKLKLIAPILALLLAGANTQLLVAHGNDIEHYYPKAKPYPLSTCLVSGDAFGKRNPSSFAYKGQQIKVCCKDCKKTFKKDPSKFLGKLNPKNSK